MAGEFLPPVLTVLDADISPLVAKVAEAKKIIQSIGDVKVPVNFDVNPASMASAKAAASALGPVEIPASLDLSTKSGAWLRGLAAVQREMRLAEGVDEKTIGGLSVSDWNAAAGAMGITEDKLNGVGLASERTFRIMGTGLRMGALGFHILLSSAIDFVAVAVPALIGAAGWVAVWLQGTTNVVQHMQAVYNASEATANMFHKTAGQAVGLKSVLQQAQNAANPEVYQALGGALNFVKEQSGGVVKAGTAIGKSFDGFVAKVDLASKSGGAFSNLMKGMQGDATGLGQVLGNIGHALVGFANSMPGWAHVLLAVVDGVTHLASSLLNLGGAAGKLVEFYFAVHEFNTWGSLLIAGMSRVGLATEKLTGNYFVPFGERTMGIFRNLAGAPLQALGKLSSGLGGLVGKFGAEGGAASKAETAMKDFGSTMGNLAASIPTWGAVLGIGLAAGLGFLIYKLLQTKSATVQWIDTLNAGIANGNSVNALDGIASGIGKVETKYVAATKAMAAAQKENDNPWTFFLSMFNVGAGAKANQDFMKAIANMDALKREESSLNTQFTGTIGRATQLSQVLHTSFVGALAAADMAGVKLQNNLTGAKWAIAYQQIMNFQAGIRAMGQTSGEVGQDMSAIAVQSGLAASKLSTLNGAWDQFMQNLSGGTGDLASLYTSIQNIGTVVGHVANNLGQGSQINLSAKQFAQSLKSMSGEGAQAWTNFDQVVGSTIPQLLDWLRTAGAEGALSGKKFQIGVLAAASSMVKFAKDSPAAKAELLGIVQQGDPAIKTFSQLREAIDKGHISLKDLMPIIDGATQKMSNMGQVAATLGTQVQNDFINQMAKAILSGKTMTGAIDKLITAVHKFGSDSPQAKSAIDAIKKALEQAGVKGSELKNILKGLQSYINSMHGPNLSDTGTPTGFSGSGTHRGGPQQPSTSTAALSSHASSSSAMSLHTHVYLDGKQIHHSVQQATFASNVRNGNRSPDGRPSGNFRPRP